MKITDELYEGECITAKPYRIIHKREEAIQSKCLVKFVDNLARIIKSAIEDFRIFNVSDNPESIIQSIADVANFIC
jgi:hypothetical protein